MLSENCGLHGQTLRAKEIAILAWQKQLDLDGLLVSEKESIMFVSLFIITQIQSSFQLSGVAVIAQFTPCIKN
jgi:hypothetical protein